ncbi:hypothetical protein vseg_019993 [Gypsophila vaccaria]
MPATRKSTTEVRRNPYVVLGVSDDSTDQQIKSAYRKLALKYHPDKNANDPKAADMFNEVTVSYNILSDPEKRRQFDSDGFEAVEYERQDLELDLSSLGPVDTVFAALFSKLGVPIKTTVSAAVLEEALNGRVSVLPLPLGQPVSRKVDKQSAHFYSVRITEEEARGGLVCRVKSEKSRFKLLYFESEDNGGLSLSLQEDSIKTGRVMSAGMYFLGFPVCRLDCSVNSAAKNPDAGLFKKLEGLQPCEVTGVKAGTHIFAVYGDNYFKKVNYTIEALSATPYVKEKERLKDVEAQLLTKRAELSKFESEHREVLAQFTEMTSKYMQERGTIDNLLKQRVEIHASYTIARLVKRSSSNSKSTDKDSYEEGKSKDKKLTTENSKKKKWYNIN